MFVKEVVIDGFKSYSKRTVVGPFDPEFNAITGLNGSGKSNILDAICFVMGITNLSQVRAANLQELVFKSGQAGVTKASVSITFDNSNKEAGPPGYEHYNEIIVTRQIVVGGRNKYLINGSNAQNNRVTDLFRSVQLNVNNPHFLIMQGRITKVLNMKPTDILSMIEEAAGTRMYETKRETAVRTIQKKDAKLTEINGVLEEQINPTLQKLRQERTNWLEHQKVQREYDHLSKLYIAWQYFQAKEARSNGDEKLHSQTEQIETLESKIVENGERRKAIEAEVEVLVQKKQEEEGDGSALHKMELELRERQKLETTALSRLDNNKESLKMEVRKLAETKKHIATDQKTIDQKRNELELSVSELDKVQSHGQTDAKEIEEAQKELQLLATGMTTDENGQAASLENQLITAREEASKAKSVIRTGEVKLNHLRSEVSKREKKLKASEQEYAQACQGPDQIEAQLKALQNQMERLGYEEGTEERLTATRRQLGQQMHPLQDRIEVFQAKFSGLNFEYKDPMRGFDRTKVKGLVAKLISLKDPASATALEVSAGGRLYNVVVDTETTSKMLLERGEIKRRVTIVPLNKISARTISNDVVRNAKKLVGDENCHLALSLVGYDREVEAAMQFVFGNTLVCPNMDMAKKVCYDRSVSKRTVSMGGDSFDPSGTLTGGSRSQKTALLQELNDMKNVQVQLNDLTNQSKQAESDLRALGEKPNNFRKLNQQMELTKKELEHARRKVADTDQGRERAELDDMNKEIANQSEEMEHARLLSKTAELKVKDLNEKLKNIDAWRAGKQKELEKKLADAKKRAQTSVKAMETRQQSVDALKLEIEDLDNGIATANALLAEIEQNIEQFKAKIEEHTESCRAAKEAAANANAAVQKQREMLRTRDKEIATKQSESDKLDKSSKAANLKIEQLKIDVGKLRKELAEAQQRIDQLTGNYDWIRQEEAQFGVIGGPFDFSQDMRETAKRLEKLREQKEKLSRNINQRAMNMLQAAEQQYDDLMQKKGIVEKDKVKINKVIADLDEKKKVAIEKAWRKINEEFSKIFAFILPRSDAKLTPVSGGSALEGLEIKVAFGGQWKESLTELSGGQRSLVALSLILAMLLFKPAPIYILDEVDAALDLSHTQNIGNLIRKHFKHSQFIIVSLKDGMFNNANVLFRTKLEDGSSVVARLQSQNIGAGANKDDEDSRKGKSRK